MDKMKNIDFPKIRGCFIDHNRPNGGCAVIDYPSWIAKNGNSLLDGNKPLPENMETEVSCATNEEAYAFCVEQNYVICARPKEKKTVDNAEVKEPAA